MTLPVTSRTIHRSILLLVALLVVAVPATAHAAGMSATQCLGAPTSTNGSDLAPANASGLAFACMVTNLLDGAAGSLAGPGMTLIRAMLPLAKWILLAMVLLEIGWIALFDTMSARPGEGAAAAPVTIFRTLFFAMFFAGALTAYTSIVDGVRDIAVGGSGAAESWITMNMKVPSTAAIMAARGNAEERADNILARYFTVSPAATDPAERLEYDRLNKLVSDTTSCIRAYLDDTGLDRADPTAAAGVDLCNIIQRKRGPFRDAATLLTAAAGKANPAELVSYVSAATLLWLPGKLIAWICNMLVAAIVAVLGIAWVILACVGPLCIAAAPWRISGNLASWWLKSWFAVSMVPIVLSFVMGLWFASLDSMLDASHQSFLMSVAGSIILLLVVIISVIIAWSGLQQMGGTALGAGMQVAKMAGTVATSGATAAIAGGASAFSTAKAGGASTGGALLSGMGAGAKAGAKQMGQGAASLAGNAAAAMGGRTDRFSESSTAKAMATATSFGASKAAAGAGKVLAKPMAAARAAVASTFSGNKSLSNPSDNGRATPAQATWEQEQQGQDLSKQLTPGTDYSVDKSTGDVALTASGSQKMTAYRVANTGRFHATRGQTNQQLANAGGVRRALSTQASGGSAAATMPFAAAHAGDPVASAIAQHLPSALTTPRIGEPPSTHQQRVGDQVRAIQQRAGGSWQRAEADLGTLSALSQRGAVASDGTRYGISSDSISVTAPAKTRQYDGQAGSPYETYRAANHGVTGETAYHATKQWVTSHTPQQGGESSTAYDQRVHEALFLAPTP